MDSKIIDRLSLLAWALVFVVGVLLVAPTAFRVGGQVAAHHGILLGASVGLLAGGFVGLAVTAIAMTRSADLRQLTAERRRRFLFTLYGAAMCVVIGVFLEVIGGAVASKFAWPAAVLVVIVAVFIGARLRTWGLSRADDWKRAVTKRD